MKITVWLFWLIVGGLFLLPLTPHIVSTSLLFPFIAGKAFFFRIIVEIIFGAWILLALFEPKYRPRRSALLIVLTAWFALITLAGLVGPNFYHSFWSNFERMEGIVSYLHLLAYFIILISVLKTEKLWWWFFHLSLAVSFVIGCLAIGQLFRAGVGTRLDTTFGNPIYL